MTSEAQPPAPQTLQSRASLEESEKLFRLGKHSEALSIFTKVLENPFITPRDRSFALCRMGHIKSLQSRFNEAKSLLSEAIKLGGLPKEIAPSCSYALVQLYVVGKQHTDALALVESQGEIELSPTYKARLWALAAESAREANDTPKEVIYLQRLLQLMESEGLAVVELKILGARRVNLEEVRKRLGRETLPSSQVSIAKTDSPPPTSSDRFGKLIGFMHETLGATHKGDWTRAQVNWKLIEKKNLAFVLERVAGFKPPADRILNRVETLRTQDPRKIRIGFLLPSDPGLVGLSFRLLRAASAFMASPASSGAMIEFFVRSSSTDPGAVEDAALKLILEDGVHAIIGPISSSLTIGAFAPAHTFGVPLFSLGPVAAPASKLSPLVVRMGVLARSQTELLASHAKNLGFEKIGTLAPNDAYGFEMAQRMSEAVEGSGLSIDRITFFDSASDVFRSAVSESLGPQDEETRKDEFALAIATAKDRARSEKRKFDPSEVKLPPLIRFDALFVPDSLRKSRVIASTYAFLDARNLRLMGDKQWNDPNSRRSIADEFINGSRVPTAITGRYMSHLLLNLGAESAASVQALGNLDLERQVFDALLLLRQGHYLAGGPKGYAMIDGLRNRSWTLEGTTVMKGLSLDGEPLTEFELLAFTNGRLSTNLPPWTGENWKESLLEWNKAPEAYSNETPSGRQKPSDQKNRNRKSPSNSSSLTKTRASDP